MADLKEEPRLVVGLGASAGGIEALSAFFAHVPPDAAIAYVVILHLSPEHESRLAEIIQAATTLPVTQVQGAVTVQPKHVYVIPPGGTLQVSDGELVTSPMTRPEQRRGSVDIFFRTLAERYGTRAVAAVLSGTGTDGSSGLKRVKESGGLTIAQLPAEARHRDMPDNAIATKLVDYVLPAAEMPLRIAEYGARMADTRRAAEDVVTGSDDDEALRDIMTVLRLRTGHDFSNYKGATVRRRVERRIAVAGLGTIAQYAHLLHERPDESTALMKELLISVTSFFRDPDAMGVLEARIIPRLFEGKGAGDQVRVWSAGCATGEEAYSLGMLLLEHAASMPAPPAIQVFASDLDAEAIEIAREGLYTEGDVVDVRADRLQRFFVRETAGYRVRRELREVLLFAHHNVIKDPPFSHLDLIVCRNLLIYLNRTIQERVIDTFHFALRPGGVLFLGASESPNGSSELFMPLDKNAQLYESRPISTRLPVPLVDRPLPPAAVLPRVGEVGPPERMSAGELHLRLLEEFAPPSVIITDDHVVVHMSERAGRFFRISGGEPSRDVMKLLREELRGDLRHALLLAAQSRQAVEVHGARLQNDAGATLVNLTVKPVLRNEQEPRGYFLLLFEDAGATPSPPPAAIALTSAASAESERLDEELRRVREQLRVTVEQYETQVEEAKASNEELQSMNEELRSATEELETSKEELQSVNEELTAVNQELKIKLEELGLTHNDFQNLISSADIGAIFVDKTLRVRLTTPRARDLFNLLPTDIGRKLSDITSRFEYTNLQNDVAQVLGKLQTVEREISTDQKRWYLLRLVPYRTLDDRIEGVALAFQDITTRHEAEQQLRVSEERLRMLVDSAVDYAMFTMTPDGRIDSWNSGAERVFGYAAGDIIGHSHDVLFTPEDRAAGVPQQSLDTARANARTIDERWNVRKNGTRFYASGVTTMLGRPRNGFARIARDLTMQQESDRAVQRAHAVLEERVHQRTAELQSEVARHASAEGRISALLRRVVSAQEDERARIARDLHDHLGQQLTALRLTLERHGEQCGATGARDDVDRALTLARDVDRAVDFLAWELRPAVLDHLGLAPALARFIDEWASHNGVTAKFQAVGSVAGLLTPDSEIAFYRVAQEALNNVAKHAFATRADVVLEVRAGSVIMMIEDDGVGFDPGDHQTSDKGIGLAGMRERAMLVGATLDVESSPGHGTTVYLRRPLPAGAQA